jgi:tripartite-type tricarboxylate transporter receptor subunit TctC
MKHSMNWSSIVGLAVLVAVACPSLRAQGTTVSAGSYPSKPIRWIVPFPAGGVGDPLARVVGPHLSERFKQPVVVDNRPGAFGIIGMETAARAAPDGYTIFLGSTNEVINLILRKRSVDPLTDLKPVSQLVRTPLVLIANPKFSPKTMPEVLSAARARPGTVTCGFGAPVLQLACELLRIQGRVDINVIPYKGVAIALNDLIGGQIDLTFLGSSGALPHVKANRVAAIAIASPKRGAGPLGHLPTVSETLPGFELEGWFGVLAPSATPREIVTRLNREIAIVLEQSEVRERLTDGGFEISHGSPEAFAEFMRKYYAKYSKIIHEAGIKAE